MAGLSRARRRVQQGGYWPGFVDAMATLLLVIIFLLSIFILTQFYLSQELAGRDSALNILRTQINELTELLALEQVSKDDIELRLISLQDSFADAQAEQVRLRGLLDTEQTGALEAGSTVAALQVDLEKEKNLSNEALAQIELLNQQMAALRRQLATIEQALEASEAKEQESNAQIAELGKRLNAALAQKVQELSRYRSDFFGKLSEVLAGRADIEVVGDRFVFQSEVLFGSASDQLNEEGAAQLDQLATALNQLENEIPAEIDWVLRIDGHTDSDAIRTRRFPSNWELSSARAISVVRHLISRGVSPARLVAAGFGEFRPLDPSETAAAKRRNRRIELKLTQR